MPSFFLHDTFESVRTGVGAGDDGCGDGEQAKIDDGT